MNEYPRPFGFGLHPLLKSENIENLLESCRRSRATVFEACACGVSQQVFAISALNRELHINRRKETTYDT